MLKLAQSANEFPVNLDEVWPLVYSRKQEAVRALTLNEQFLEDVDYKTVRKDAQGGQFASTDYYLTLSCMEFFIARKVRPVFEVYRKVFHHTVQNGIGNNKNPKREPTLTTKVRVGIEWIKGVSEMLNLNDTSVLGMLKEIAAPLGYQILTVQIKNNVPCIWAIVDDNEKHIIDCKIRTIGTGHYFDNHLLDYIGTYQFNQLVLHVFKDDSPF